MKSINAGNDWEYLRFADTLVHDIDISPRNSNIVFATVANISVDYTGIWKSENGGLSWNAVLRPGYSCERLTRLTISNPSPDTIFAIYDGRWGPHEYNDIYYSRNEGLGWQLITPSGWPRLNIDDIYSSPLVDGFFILATKNGLVTTNDFLNSYGFSYAGLLPKLATPVVSTYLENDNFLVCLGNTKADVLTNTLWRSIDNGNTWQMYQQWIPRPQFPYNPKFMQWVTRDSIFLVAKSYVPDRNWFLISPNGGVDYNGVFSANMDFTYFDVYGKRIVYLLGNYGGSYCYLWQSEYPFLRSITLPPKSFVNIHPFNPNIIFLGGNNGGFWKSTDGGQTLVLSNTGLPTRNNVVSSIATGFSTDDRPITLYCGFKKTQSDGIAGLYKSTDLGTTWHPTGLTEEINELKVDPYDPSILYISTPENIYVSYDYAVHLMTLNHGLNELKSYTIDLSTIRPHLFCGTRHGIFKFSPIRLFSGTPIATGYQTPKVILKDNTVYLTYQTLGGVYFATADMAGQKKVRHFGMKNGEFPTVTLDASGKPCAIWQENTDDFPYPVGKLWFSKYDGVSWSEPYLLFAASGAFGAEFNPPSFIIDTPNNKGYVCFETRYFGMNGPASVLHLGKFSIDNPSDFQLWQLESAFDPIRCEFPSISQGGNYLYIAFQREHKIFRIKWDIINQQIDNITQVSQDGRFSHHPFVDVQTNGVINYVWEDSTATNIEIYSRYELNNDLFPVEIEVTTPGKSQWQQICKGTTWITWSEYIWPPQDNNWEICYKDMEYEGYQILSQTPEMSKYSHGVVIRSPYWPPPYEPKLTPIWTEGNQAPYEIRAKTVNLPDISYFYIDDGRETPSPWTVQRDGYIQFAPEPEKTIDYHSQKLIYHFPNLNPAKRYRIKLFFYFESQSSNPWRMKIDGDNIFHANIWIKPGEIMTLERWLPTACYKDGEIYLNITKVIGNYALLAQVFIYEYERETKEIASATNIQEAGNSVATALTLTVSPNPCYSQTIIHYSLPAQSPATLKIYDASGRLVKLFNHSTIQPYNYVSWNCTDENDRALPSGIYFVVLENGNAHLTEKLILLR